MATVYAKAAICVGNALADIAIGDGYVRTM
jgi:hypothetical protein